MDYATQISGTSARPRRGSRFRRKQLVGLLFVLPAVSLVLLFFVIPLGMAFWMSLHNWPLLGRARFIGFDNYVNLLQDTRFWNAMRFTVYYTVVVTVADFLRGISAGAVCRTTAATHRSFTGRLSSCR